MAKMDDTEIKALLANEIASAERYISSDLAGQRERAILYYSGQVPDVPAIAGRSQYVDRTVSNVLGWTLPGIIRVFTASDRMVDCLPETPEDEEVAEQAADYLNFVFWRDNNGYLILHNATHDALLNKDGIVKQYWHIQEKVTHHVYTGLSEDQIAVLLSDDDVEITEQSEPYFETIPAPSGPDPVADDGAPIPPEAEISEAGGQVQQVALYDIKIKRTCNEGRLKYEVVPPEDFLIDRNATDENNWRFMAHKVKNVTRSDLIEMGFKRKTVDEIPAFNMTDTTPEFLARHGYSDVGYDIGDRANDKVTLYEAYLKADINDDGIAEIVKVFYTGDSGEGAILDWEEWDDEVPFDKIPCNPVPHRWASDSLADEVIDIQKFKTVIGRQMFDNLYQTNMPQPIVEEGSVLNMDAVVNPGIGVPIIIKKGANPIGWNAIPFVADKSLMAMEYLDAVTEMRTGVSRSSMALDPDTMQNQTATAVQTAKDASYSQIELIARNQAELGWKKVFAKSLRILAKNQDRPRTIRLRNEWMDMDPRSWNTGMDIVINVGLGTGSRDRDMAMLNNILQTQIGLTDRMAQAGMMEQALDMLPKVVKTSIKIAEAAGIKAPETFYPEVQDEQLAQIKQQMAQQQGQPDPKTQMEMQKVQMQMQLEQAKMQAARDKEMAQMEADVQVKQVEMEKNAALQQQQQEFEAAKFTATQELEREKMALNYQIEVMKLEHDTAVKAASAGAQAVKGKDGKTAVKTNDTANFELMMSALDAMRQQNEQNAAAIERMANVHAAPTEIVRDPATGRPIGARKVIQ